MAFGKRLRRAWVLVILASAMAGCAGQGGAPHAHAPAVQTEAPSFARDGSSPASTGAESSPAASAAAPSTADVSVGQGGAAGAAPAAASGRSRGVDGAAESPPVSASREAPRPSPPRERPGLGTAWGETRASHVHDVSFTRADEDRPFAVATLHYNDRAGVDALAAYHARASAPLRARELPAAGGAISVAIEDAAGEPLEAVRFADRTYVVGRPGERYSIVITNHTDHRFEAVATVDGLDVLDGRPGTTTNRGYLLMPYATLTIDGFRQSQDAVAAFRFAKVSQSYAAQTGSARNVGVIGVAFFAEAGDPFAPWTEDELRTRDTARPFPGDSRFARPPRR